MKPVDVVSLYEAKLQASEVRPLTQMMPRTDSLQATSNALHSEDQHLRIVVAGIMNSNLA